MRCWKKGPTISKTSWGVLFLGLLVGPLFGFRCRCTLSPGKVKDYYTAAWVKLPEQKIGPRTKVYSPLHQQFCLVVTYENLPPETELRTSWYYLGKGKGAEKKLHKLFYVRPIVVEGSGVSVFRAPSRGKIWPVGYYEARLELDGKPKGTARFQVFSGSKVEAWLFVAKKPLAELGKGPPPKKEKTPVFSSTGDTVALRLEMANPKPKSALRVMWHRMKKNGEFSFYAESDEIVVRQSKRLTFVLPKVKKGYCPGRYRVTVTLNERAVTKKLFTLKEPGSRNSTDE